MLKRYAVILAGLAITASAAPAWATATIGCSGIGNDAEVTLTIGAGPVPNLISAVVSVNETLLTTIDGQNGQKASIAQAYDDGEVLRLDLVDEQAENALAAVRIVRADDKSGSASAGVVQIHGLAPAAILCEGP